MSRRHRWRVSRQRVTWPRVRRRGASCRTVNTSSRSSCSSFAIWPCSKDAGTMSHIYTVCWYNNTSSDQAAAPLPSRLCKRHTYPSSVFKTFEHRPAPRPPYHKLIQLLSRLPRHIVAAEVDGLGPPQPDASLVRLLWEPNDAACARACQADGSHGAAASALKWCRQASWRAVKPLLLTCIRSVSHQASGCPFASSRKS